MSKVQLWGTVIGAVMAVALGGCGGSSMSRAQPSAPAAQSDVAYDASGEAPVYEEAEMAPASAAPRVYGGSSTAQPSAAEASNYGEDSASEARMKREPTPSDRPGLGTAWGETRRSPTTTAPFVRDSASPFAVASLWYNDRQGADAMARWADYRTHSSGAVPVLGGALTVSLRDESGRPLRGFFAGGKDYVVGEAGTRYAIIIRNNTGYRYECVASVDGLDVIDGRTAAYTKRGYLIQPHGMLEIEGFRRSEDAVAAFRFSSVRGSYSSRSGKGDRNVGVIGVAFFNEEGTRPTWTPEELRRRHNADPFPGRYAEPPH